VTRWPGPCAAGDAERRRIERDLHDSAQQRLIALRIHLSMASERIDHAEQREMVEELGTELEEALDELRSVASGAYPGVLRQAGVAAALRSVLSRAAIPITIHDSWQGRHPEPVEVVVYFCCLEALQNAAKHAGSGSAASVRLAEEDGYVTFAVSDDGVGFELHSAELGAGLRNIDDRLAAAGGALHIESAPGRGTRLAGRLPT
jgi:signal transduction histidine kinase